MEKYSLQRINISLLIIATLIFLNTIKGIAIPSWYLIASFASVILTFIASFILLTIGEWKNDKKGKVGTYYLNSKVVIDVVIEGNILNGVYKANGKEKYINDIDLNIIEEKEMLENIEKYLNDNINHHNHSKNI